jgi:hypothetical protein
MNLLRACGRIILAWLVLAVLPTAAAPHREYGKIELMRDTWGIPHDFSNTDAGAMPGSFYAWTRASGAGMFNCRTVFPLHRSA